MGAIWSEKAKFDSWLKVEIAACEAWARLGRIPKKDLGLIKKKASFPLNESKPLSEKQIMI